MYTTSPEEWQRVSHDSSWGDKSTECGTRESSSTGKNITTAEELVMIFLLVLPSVSSNKWTINQSLGCVGQPTKVMDLGITEVPEEMFIEML